MDLLRAALLTGNIARESAERWFEAHQSLQAEGFRELDEAARRLLPLVERNLKDGLPAGIRKELRSVRNHYWAANQRLFRGLEKELLQYEAAGIPTLVLKGAALAVAAYGDMSSRPMSDFDILIPETRIREKVQEYIRDGWQPGCIPPSAHEVPYFYRFRHAINLTHPDHGGVDLHWHVLLEATFEGADKLFWEGSVPLQIKSAATRMLNPADQLLHTCMHGYPYNPMPPVRWVADAMTILRTTTVDWQRLLHVAEELHVSMACLECLTFLNDFFAVNIPGFVIESLANIRREAREERYFQRMANPGARRWWETLEDVSVAVDRANKDRGLLSKVVVFPRHLQFEQQLPSFASLLPHVGVFLKRRFD